MQSDFHTTLRSTLLILLIIGFLPGAFAGEADSFRWIFEGQRRVSDSGVEAHFSLRGTEALKIDELEFFYTAEPARRRNPDVQQESRKTVYYKKVPADIAGAFI